MGEKLTRIIIPFVGILLFLIICISPLPAQVVTQDSLALVALYDSTNGDSWNTNTNWKTGAVATWHGVIVSGDRVTQIILPGNGLTGQLPAAIGDLDQLAVLILNNNAIGDTLPSQLGNVNSLSMLSLFANNFSGKIPPSLGSLSNLTKLYLYDNALTDTIPGQLGNLSLLQELDMSGNQLQGNDSCQPGESFFIENSKAPGE